MNGYRVRHGGLMRCCLATLHEVMVTGGTQPVEGDTLLCRYCSNTGDPGGMIFHDGAWEWNSKSKHDAP